MYTSHSTDQDQGRRGCDGQWEEEARRGDPDSCVDMFGGVWAPFVVTGGASEHSYTVPGGKKRGEREGGRERERGRESTQ